MCSFACTYTIIAFVQLNISFVDNQTFHDSYNERGCGWFSLKWKMIKCATSNTGSEEVVLLTAGH